MIIRDWEERMMDEGFERGPGLDLVSKGSKGKGSRRCKANAMKGYSRCSQNTIKSFIGWWWEQYDDAIFHRERCINSKWPSNVASSGRNGLSHDKQPSKKALAALAPEGPIKTKQQCSACCFQVWHEMFLGPLSPSLLSLHLFLSVFVAGLIVVMLWQDGLVSFL